MTPTLRKLRHAKLLQAKRAAGDSNGSGSSGGSAGAQGSDTPLSTDLESTTAALKRKMSASGDLVIRRLLIGDRSEAAIAYLAGMTDVMLIHDAIVRPLMAAHGASRSPAIDDVETRIVSAANVTRISSLDLLVDEIITGKTAVIIAGLGIALAVNTEGWEKRAVEESAPRSSSGAHARVSSRLCRTISP